MTLTAKILAFVGAWFVAAIALALVWIVVREWMARRKRCTLCLASGAGRYFSRMGRVCGPCLDAIFKLYDRPRRRSWQPKRSPFEGEGWRNG